MQCTSCNIWGNLVSENQPGQWVWNLWTQSWCPLPNCTCRFCHQSEVRHCWALNKTTQNHQLEKWEQGFLTQFLKKGTQAAAVPYIGLMSLLGSVLCWALSHLFGKAALPYYTPNSAKANDSPKFHPDGGSILSTKVPCKRKLTVNYVCLDSICSFVCFSSPYHTEGLGNIHCWVRSLSDTFQRPASWEVSSVVSKQPE